MVERLAARLGGLEADRELVIDRAIATDSSLGLSKLKVIVLMVMWRHQHSLDTLLLEELLAADDDEDGENRLYH